MLHPQSLMTRVATPEDFQAVDSLLRRSYPALLKADYKPSEMVTAVPMISRAQPSLFVSGTYMVVEYDGDILAAGGWTLEAPGGRTGRSGEGHVRHVVTDHRHVRRGLGRALMTRTIETARASGIGRLICQSTLTAVPFYKQMGFVEKTRMTIELAPGVHFPAVAMSLDIRD